MVHPSEMLQRLLSPSGKAQPGWHTARPLLPLRSLPRQRQATTQAPPAVSRFAPVKDDERVQQGSLPSGKLK